MTAGALDTGTDRLRQLRQTFTLDGVTGGLALLLVVTMLLLPLVFLLVGSLSTGSPGERGAQFTLDHVRTVYLSGKYVGPFLNTVRLAAAVTLTTTCIGTLFAWLVARTELPNRRLIELLIIVPIFVSPLLGALAWVALAAPQSGFINALARTTFGATENVVDIYSFWGIVFVMTLYFIPYAYLFVVGAFRNLDSTLEDAATMLGAGLGPTLRHVTLPLVLPSLFSSALLVFILSSELFSVPTMLAARGESATVPTLIYLGFQLSSVPRGELAALATMLLWLSVAGLVLYRRTIAIARRYVTVSGKGRQPRKVALGALRHLAIGAIAIYLVLAVVLPYLALILGSLLRFLTPRIQPSLFTLENYAALASPAVARAIGNTLVLGIAGATITVVLSFTISYLIVRGRGLALAAVDYLSSIPIAIPSMALAVGLLWAYTTLPLPVYGTIFMLLIAYVTRFVAVGIRIASATLQQIDPELEEAARMTGLGRLATFWQVTFALMKPSIVSTWSLLFLFMVVEISATILLYSPGSVTMSVVLWNAVEMTGSVGAFTLGTIQITLIFCMMALAYRLAGSWNIGLE